MQNVQLICSIVSEIFRLEKRSLYNGVYNGPYNRVLQKKKNIVLKAITLNY